MTLEIFLLISITVINLYLALFKSYFQEKGRNIATSEDLEKITLKVESVKQHFSDKNAALKSKLDLLTNLQTSYKVAERNAILEFNKKLKIWINLLSSFPPVLVGDFDDKTLHNKLTSINSIYHEFLEAEALLELYINHDKLSILLNTLKKDIAEHLALHTLNYLGKLMDNNAIFNEVKGKAENEENLEDASEKLSKAFNERKALFNEYSHKIKEGRKIVQSSENNYRKYVKDYIKKTHTTHEE